MHSKIFLTTGEFAKLCNTTKNTLFHYDTIDLLKPVHTNENGYRFYSIDQFSTFDMISVLQDSGSSLKEIKEFIKHQNADNFLTILADKKKTIKQQQQHLKQLNMSIDYIIQNTKKAMDVTYFEPIIETVEEEHIVCTPFLEVHHNEQDYYESISSHIAYCQKYEINDDLSYGVIYKKEDIFRGYYRESYYYSYLSKKRNIPNMKTKEKGTYAFIYHKGSYDELKNTYQILLSYITNNNLKVISDFYEYELLNHLQTDDPNNYSIEISVMVK